MTGKILPWQFGEIAPDVGVVEVVKNLADSASFHSTEKIAPSKFGIELSGGPKHIVNTASILGHLALPDFCEHVSAKYAVMGLSEALKMELLATQVGVSFLYPGLVSTSLGIPGTAARPVPGAVPRLRGIQPSHFGDGKMRVVAIRMPGSGNHTQVLGHPRRKILRPSQGCPDRSGT